MIQPTPSTVGSTGRESGCGRQGTSSPSLSSVLRSSPWPVPAAYRDRERSMGVSPRLQAAARHREPDRPPGSPSLLPSACGPTACQTSQIRPGVGQCLGRAAGLIRRRHSFSAHCKPASPLRRPRGCRRGHRAVLPAMGHNACGSAISTQPSVHARPTPRRLSCLR
jgi:hypothetical protein